MRLFILGQEIELRDSVVAQNKQVNDITSLSTRQTNYTNSFNIPRTAKNTRTLKDLGLVGNDSNVPYQKNVASLFSDTGECFVFEGWAEISEAGKDYKCNIYDGNLELYKVIENKTLADLVLTDLNHNKTTAEVVATFDNSKPYKYILADYNGQAVYDVDNKINIDYLIPSVKASWLVDAIQTYSGFTFNGSFKTDPDYTDLYLTYPKGTAVDTGTTQIYNPTSGLTPAVGLTVVGQQFTATEQITINFDVSDNLALRAEQPNFYVVVMGTLNGSFINSGKLVMNEGDVLSVSYQTYGEGTVDSGTTWISFIDKYNSQTINFLEELKGLSMRDFMNEIVWRFGLTLFKDKYTNVYGFKTLSEITDTDNAIVWGSVNGVNNKYVGKVSEKYIFGSYAQYNYFRYKYNDDKANYNDGFLKIDNQNLDDSKTAIQSKIFSPELANSDSLGFTTKVYKLWDKEVKDDQSAVKYKDLTNRFYFIKSKNKTFSPAITIGSLQLTTSTTVTSAPVENFTGLSFNQIIYNKYGDIQKLLNKSKVVIFEMNLKDSDVCDIDFSVPYFIEQEGAYFMLNKITNFVPNKSTTVEMVRLSFTKVPTPAYIPDYSSSDYSNDYLI
jgi:hypothetical protein